MWPLHPRRPRR